MFLSKNKVIKAKENILNVKEIANLIFLTRPDVIYYRKKCLYVLQSLL